MRDADQRRWQGIGQGQCVEVGIVCARDGRQMTGDLGELLAARQDGRPGEDLDFVAVVDTAHADVLCARPWRSAGRTTVTVRQDGQMPSPVVLEVKFKPGKQAIRPMRNGTR